MEQPTQLPNNSVQDHLISRLSDQVRGLEDKQDIVKKGWLIFFILENQTYIIDNCLKIIKNILVMKIMKIVRCPNTFCEQTCIDFLQFNRCMN